MAQVIEVSDPGDPRLADFRDLSTADRRPDRPGGRGLVIAEGVVVVRRLLASPYPVRALLGVRRRIEAMAEDLDGIDAPAYVATAEVMAETVGFHLNRGVLASADRAPAPDPLELVERARTVAVLEGVGDHENLGALFRNAAALGVDAVLLAPGCSDPLYRRSVRVSMGHVLAVPFAPIEPWPDGVKWLRDSGFRVLALTPRADSVPLSDAVGPGERVAVLLGSEGPGLTDAAIDAADAAVRIPMAGGVDSLNVATAAAVAFYALNASSEGGS
ncbi:TrmH family RNA methyltransferase [Actinokineospora iranica]|uniref:tRNA G18 (Ribose-2'-O)-methylase SpoU n=1 Tax=Actinokineospora iranica TaxID=1271860 RepID=A0A1G6TGU5_9PSEU|nr:RNA methyltransferase [Actinokineospora iranica]SDD28261.1 tRNA G18 (ribose-2'-O)-methylase SpoU [Actinokineospora iranica]